MKTLKKHWLTLLGTVGGGLVVVATVLTAWSQTAPVLTIAPTGTNQLLITITNGVSTLNYDLYSTPVLANPSYPWKAAVIGSTGQTNFTVNAGPYLTGFFEVLVDTNSIPIWELADPNNPSAGILTVFIDSPTNGAVLQ
jgi:hypothetical protein